MAASDADAPIEWVREDRWFTGTFAKPLNRAMLLHLGPVVAEYERTFATTADTKTAWRIRRDLTATMRWGACARFVQAAVERTIEGALVGLSLFLLITAPGLLVSDGPLWLKVVLVGSSAALSLRTGLSEALWLSGVHERVDWAWLPETLRVTGKGPELAPEDDPERRAPAFKIVGRLSLFTALTSVVLLVWIWPPPPHGALAAEGIAFLTAVTILLMIPLSLAISVRYRVLRRATIALTVLVLAGYGQWWLLGKVEHAAWWYAPEFGALLGTAIGVLLAVLQLGQPLFDAAQTSSTLRRHPESEFVQSAMRALNAVNPPATNRIDIVRRLEYLAVVLERGVAGALRREDPASAADIASMVGARAAALRARKRDVLFGKAGAQDKVHAVLRDLVVLGADHKWLALAADPGWTTAERPRLIARAARLAVRVVIFLLPFAIGALVAIFGNAPLNSWLPAAVPFALGWVAVNLAELITPGSGTGVADTAAGTEMVAKRLRGRR